jgi:hypothetical protein
MIEVLPQPVTFFLNPVRLTLNSGACFRVFSPPPRHWQSPKWKNSHDRGQMGSELLMGSHGRLHVDITPCRQQTRGDGESIGYKQLPHERMGAERIYPRKKGLGKCPFSGESSSENGRKLTQARLS